MPKLTEKAAPPAGDDEQVKSTTYLTHPSLSFIRSVSSRSHFSGDRLYVSQFSCYWEMSEPRTWMSLDGAQYFRLAKDECRHPCSWWVFVAAFGGDDRYISSFYGLNMREADVLIHRYQHELFGIAIIDETRVSYVFFFLSVFLKFVRKTAYLKSGLFQLQGIDCCTESLFKEQDAFFMPLCVGQDASKSV